MRPIGRREGPEGRSSSLSTSNQPPPRALRRAGRGGLPIGSGVVEAACKPLVAQRLKCSGMRWGEDGGRSGDPHRARVDPERALRYGLGTARRYVPTRADDVRRGKSGSASATPHVAQPAAERGSGPLRPADRGRVRVAHLLRGARARCALERLSEVAGLSRTQRLVTLYRRLMQGMSRVFLFSGTVRVFAGHASLLSPQRTCGAGSSFGSPWGTPLRAFPRLTLRAHRDAAVGSWPRGAVGGAYGGSRRNLQFELFAVVRDPREPHHEATRSSIVQVVLKAARSRRIG
jgi:hypothetical protein